LIENWRRGYNRVRPHNTFGYRPPVPEATWASFMSAALFGTLGLS